MMKIRYAVPATLFALAMFGATPALAQGEEAEEAQNEALMMNVVEGAAADESDYAAEISLPDEARRGEGNDEDGGFDEARENAAGPGQLGLDVAEEARQLEGADDFESELEDVKDAARNLNADSVRSELPAPEETGDQR